LIRVIAPRASQTSTALLLMARFNDVFLDSQFENGGEGLLYTYELIYYPTSTVDGNPESLKRPQPDNVIPQDIQDLGNNKEYYRWFFLLENHHDRDEYRRLMEFCKKFAAPVSILEESVREVMDVDEWMRTFAMYSLCGIGDTYTQGLDHNNMHYIRPSDEMVLVFPWDMDFAFVRSTTAGLWGDRNLSRIIMRPVFTRMFYRHLLDLIDTTYNTTYMTYWINHYGSLVNQDFRSIRSYISARANYVRSRIPQGTTFAIVTQGGDDFSVDENHVLIDGNAPIEAAILLLNDKEVTVKWRGITRWQVDVPLLSGPNKLTFSALDEEGGVIGTDEITVTSNFEYDPPRVFVVMPAQGPSTGGTEVKLLGENFLSGIEVTFGGVPATEVTYVSPVEVRAVTPPGEGQVEIEVRNPDGLTGKATVLFIYIPVSVEASFKRGDANADGAVDIADAVKILGYLFATSEVTCLDACDVNDDGSLNIADPIALLGYIFASGDPPPAPFEACGSDPTDTDRLGCESFVACE